MTRVCTPTRHLHATRLRSTNFRERENSEGKSRKQSHAAALPPLGLALVFLAFFGAFAFSPRPTPLAATFSFFEPAVNASTTCVRSGNCRKTCNRHLPRSPSTCNCDPTRLYDLCKLQCAVSEHNSKHSLHMPHLFAPNTNLAPLRIEAAGAACHSARACGEWRYSCLLFDHSLELALCGFAFLELRLHVFALIC